MADPSLRSGHGLPNGTVTFLFTDIEGSTTRWEHRPEAMQAALARHDGLVRAAIVEHGGHVVKTMGDAFHAAFSRAPDAVVAALDAQRRLQNEPWGEIGTLRVRMALHTGAAEERDGDYYGPSLNRAARMLSTGHGGQVLLSQTTYDLVRDTLPAGATLLDLGDHRLKDLIRPEHVFQVVAPDLPSEFPPLVSLDARPNNLPIQPTPLVGRESDITIVRQQLLCDDVRLLTLTGPGGTGKTRLGLHVAADVSDQFADGVFFVTLAPITDPDLVLPTIAQTLGIRDPSSRSPLESLKGHLREKELLLLLDNFEQVLSAAPRISDLLAAAIGLKILVTSRAALQVRGEHEYAVTPLALPNRQQTLETADLSQYGAVALFIERASAIKADFTITNENAPAVAEICHRLDGLPLAIELAAMRIRLLTPEVMLTRLEHRLPLLTGGARDLPARQQTLRGAIEWSYDLLDPSEQALFRRLAIFVGGCGLEAAEAVCIQDAEAGIDLIDGLSSLIAKSLLRQDERSGDVRFTMLETIREYALDQLEARGETTTIRRCHRDWYLDFAEQVSAELRGPRQAELLRLLEAEHANLRSALEWTIAEPDGVEAGADLVEALAWFWVVRGYIPEARAQVADLLEWTAGHSTARAKVLSVAGYLASLQIDPTAVPLLEESLAIWRDLGETRGIATALTELGRFAWRRGDAERAIALIEECMALVRGAGSLTARVQWLAPYGESPISLLASMAAARGDDERAAALFEEDVALCRTYNDQHGLANAQRWLARLIASKEDADRATSLLKESLRLLWDLDDRGCIPINLEGLACIAGDHGSAERVVLLLAAASTFRQASGAAPHPTNAAEHERALSIARASIGEQQFRTLWADGLAMTWEQAVAYALDDAP
ncbi:MAG: adenylate/guanylate cyclase domain-containing protein [Chloroflexi bacterium]|nr:adenylate/guanylate cyclase domain-containing protein [Chloroflexota bacterium]